MSTHRSEPEGVPPLVTLDVWGVAPRQVPRALARMGRDRSRIRALPGVTFAKMLGTGSGRTFTTRDADPAHWASLIVWNDEAAAQHFAQSSPGRGWASITSEHARFEMRPLSARGTWAGRAPFGNPVVSRWDGPVAAVTRARIKPSQWVSFWRSVPPVSHDLDQLPGSLFRLGIGEAPLGLQGTFSVWSSNRALTEFAHRRPAHADVMRRTHETGWYAEELFARFALVNATGHYRGEDIGGLAP